jgi:hypothetical protein
VKERLRDCRWRRSRVRTLAAACLLPLAGGVLPADAQSLSDPADRIYRHLAIWEQRGYFAPLPVLRPYTPQLVVDLLRQVAAAGARPDRELAAAYLAELVPEDTEEGLRLPPITASVYGELTAGLPAAPGPRLLFGGALESTSLFGQFAYTAAFRYWWESAAEPAPRYRPRQRPVFPTAGPNFPVGGIRFRGKEDLRATAAFGTARLSLQGGFAQGAFGAPPYDSVVLGTGAPPTAHLAAVFRGDRITYTAAFMELVAEQAVRPDGTRYRLKGNPGTTGFPSKYLMLHALQWQALPWLSLDAFSTALFGARLSLYSLLPMAFVTEPFTLDYDNTLAGVAARVRLPWGLSAAATLYLDDYNLFAGETFNPSPFANKTAGQAALSWAPPAVTGVVGMVSLDYLFVAPYMYTHSSHQPINYLTYTHRKLPLANALQPNSDQWTVAALATPAAGLDLELTARAIRHGNASARRAQRGPYDDGSIWDDGYDEGGKATFVGPSPFLEGMLEHVYQLELAASGRFPVLSLLKLEARVSYAIERIDNRDLEQGATATNHLFGVLVTVEL